MRPVNISVHEHPKFLEGSERVYAKDQPDYLPLPTIAFPGPQGLVISKWEPSEEDRARISSGGPVYLGVWTFEYDLQPVTIGTTPEDIIQ